eukprot:1863481-Amphidinium_carterae.1
MSSKRTFTPLGFTRGGGVDFTRLNETATFCSVVVSTVLWMTLACQWKLPATMAGQRSLSFLEDAGTCFDGASMTIAAPTSTTGL